MEAQLLASRILEKPKTWLLAHPEYLLTSTQRTRLSILLAKRAGGEPLPYLLGEWEFFGLSFYVTPDVLIPRPETELLVELALEWLRAHPDARQAADIGTGAGCIAVSLAKSLPDLHVSAVDVSPAALAVAMRNVMRHEIGSQVTLLQGDLLNPLSGSLPLICANLPYIPTESLSGLPVAQSEPLLALDGGVDGLAYIQELLLQACQKPPACLLLEIEHRQGVEAAALTSQIFPRAHVEVHKDLSGDDRVLQIGMDANETDLPDEN